MQGWTATTRHGGVTRKRNKKIKAQEICLKEPPTVMLILESNWLHFDKEGPAVLHTRICSLFKDSK